MLDRRSEPRLMCADMVDLQWKDGAGAARDCTAVLEDISTSGACLQVDSPLASGTHVEIAYRRGRLKGRVSYCFFREIGYWIGVEFVSKSKWSARDYRPRHLLDPQTLIGPAEPRKTGKRDQ